MNESSPELLALVLQFILKFLLDVVLLVLVAVVLVLPGELNGESNPRPKVLAVLPTLVLDFLVAIIVTTLSIFLENNLSFSETVKSSDKPTESS